MDVTLLDAEGIPAALTEAEKALWRLAGDMSDAPLTGEWRVVPEDRRGEDINAKVVVSVLSTGRGVKTGCYVARCPSAMEADYIGGLSPRVVLAMLNELAALRSASPEIARQTAHESHAEAVADLRLPPAPYRPPVKLDRVEDKWHDDDGFLNAAGVKEVVRLYVDLNAPMSQIAKHVGLRSPADVRNVLERAGAIDDEIARRNAKIREQAERGVPLRVIGEPYELTAGRVQQIVRRA